MWRVGLSLTSLIGALFGAHLCFAQLTMTDVGGGFGGAGVTFVGVGDIVSGWQWYYSCTWAYNAAYISGTKKLCNIRRSSDSHTCDIQAGSDGSAETGVTAGCSTGGDNGSSVSSFCNATSCFAVTAYNQSGSTIGNITQATSGNQPQLSLAAVNGHLVLIGDGVTDFNLTLSSIGTNAMSQPYSSVAMGKWATASSFSGALGTDESSGVTFAGIFSGSPVLNCASSVSVAGDTNPHAFFMLANSPTNSFIRSDSTNGTAGDCGSRVIANNDQIGILHVATGFSLMNGSWGEWGVIGSDQTSNAAALTANIKTTRWGF